MSGVVSVSTVGSSMPSRTFPPHATVAPSATASSIHDVTRSVSPFEMSDDTSVASSSGSPTTSASTSGTSSPSIRAAIDSCTYTRWVEMHDCPAWLNPATEIFLAAVSTSESGSRITGALFPSSKPTFLRAGAPADRPSDLGRAGEGDHGDVVVVDQRVADVRPAPGDDVEVPRREPALRDQQAGERDRRQRRL